MDLLQQNCVRAWLSSALAEAHRHHFELSRRLPAISVAQRMRREARRLANSASGYEQLVRQALIAKADYGDKAYRSQELRRLLQDPDPVAQHALRERLLFASAADHDARAVGTAALREERRGRRRAGSNPDVLATWLLEAAALHRAVWDHPALDVDGRVRAALLASADRLEARARELAPAGPAAAPLTFSDPLPTRVPNRETWDGAR